MINFKNLEVLKLNGIEYDEEEILFLLQLIQMNKFQKLKYLHSHRRKWIQNYFLFNNFKKYGYLSTSNILFLFSIC